MKAEVTHTSLQTYGSIERALRWGWTVRCHVLKIQFPVGGVEFTVEDVRLTDPELEDEDFQVLTLQGWQTPTRVWALRHARKPRRAKAVSASRI
jgi:hypothetical protein